MIKIDKKEMEYLVKRGVRFGENGLFKTVSNVKTYYIAETRKNLEFHNQYMKSIGL